MPQRVSNAEKFSFCVPITPDSCNESECKESSFIQCRGASPVHDLFDNNCNRNNGNMFTSQTIKSCPVDLVTRDSLPSHNGIPVEDQHSTSTSGESLKPSCSKAVCSILRESKIQYHTQMPLLSENVLNIVGNEQVTYHSENDRPVLSMPEKDIGICYPQEKRKEQWYMQRPLLPTQLSLNNSPVKMGITNYKCSHNIAHHSLTNSPLPNKFSLHLMRSVEQAPLACSETTDSMSSVC